MSPRVFLLSLSPLLAATAAHAQAPGELAPAAAPCAQPVAVAPVAVSVMANRWAIGLSFGSLSVAPEETPDAQTNFSIGEIALRYRVTRHLELELALGGGREVLEDNSEGELEATAGVLAARYRFLPEHKWNWFVMGGLGAASIANHDATPEERNAQNRPLVQLGLGVERRFRRLALQAELRGVAMGPREDRADAPTVMPGTAAAATPPAPMAATDQLSGGTFTLGASYYF